ncbi:1-acyl-sn-glycerol-3-phosphate acyltransferase [Crocosphaera sp.]|uniref:1-acyl-sn-glycerol-3-phosphate acyltransferase n=1 Tax=Crocosphaera sp. TaxID=2729996 RepID=UPI00260A4144|nr:1-acyl-sn-glycerol-3-phosphate acyltransferase [Crocosphaera sp.]MDJ0580041.1 1-acyl-sn-glycerol-3-phosphate acyltransferase [Crocosphaera sp.]
MNQTSIHAQPPLEHIPPNFNPWLYGGVKTFLPLWLQWQTTIQEIEGNNIERLADYYQQFQDKKVRFLMAFRHPSVNDSYCMGYLVWKLLPKVAKEKKISLKHPLHSHFMYDRGIPLWAGSAVGWLYSKLGGTSIQRGKLDIPGLRSARELFVNSQFPISAAPEGATNGHNEIISPLEPGISQLGFWCAEDLRKSNRKEDVFIVPIGIQYFYISPPWQEIEKLLTQLEKDAGISSKNHSLETTKLYERLYQLGEHFLGVMENFYQQFYHQPLAEESGQTLQERLKKLLNTSLEVAENYFNLKQKGTVIDRCRRLEQAGWDYIYRDDFKEINKLSSLEKGLGDRIAEEASLRMWHMRLVESFVAVTGYYVKDKPSAERFADTVLLLWDVVAKIKGENPFFRPQLGKQKALITVGDPISVSDRFDDYKKSRRQAVSSLTQDLENSLDRLIIRS